MTNGPLLLVMTITMKMFASSFYSLKDYIQYRKDFELIEDVEKIPEGVLLTHVFSFWKLVLGFSDRCHTQRIQATG